MTQGKDRMQRVVWTDILMAQKNPDDFTYEGVKIVGPQTRAAVPAKYRVTITKSGDATADETLIIGGVTFTAKASPSTDAGTTDFATNATAAEIAAIVQAKGLTNYTITDNENGTLDYVQTTAGTGSAVTIGSGTSNKATATVTTVQAYIAENSANPQYEIEPGEPVYLVSTDSNGVKTVAPINHTESAQVSAFCGFAIDRHIISKGETDDSVVIATGGVRLDRNMLPTADQFGNAISWDYADGSIRKVAEGKDFYFGQSAR